MAPRVGKDGWASLLGSSERPTYFDAWSIKSNIGTADITGYGANSREFAQTLRDWSVSVGGTYDRSDTHQDAFFDNFSTTSQAALTLRLYVSSTESWRGSALPTGMIVNSVVGDKVSWSGDLQGTSNLTYSTTGA